MSSSPRYRIDVKRSAQREIAALPRRVQAAVVAAIDAVADEPRPSGCRALKGGGAGLYRIRIAGDYRIVYRVQDSDRTVHVLLVGHRRDVYRRLP